MGYKIGKIKKLNYFLKFQKAVTRSILDLALWFQLMDQNYLEHN